MRPTNLSKTFQTLFFVFLIGFSVAAQQSNSAEYYVNQGIKYFTNKQYKESVAANQQAILLNPKDSRAYKNLGLSYLSLGKNDEALFAFKQALSISPDGPKIYHGLGITYYVMGNYKEAIAAYNQALALEPNNTDLKAALADAKAALAKSGDANEIKAVSPGDAQPSVTAEDLHKEFQKNFYAAKEKYEGKTLKVTGKVKYVNVSDGEVTISLTDNGFSTPVEFLLPDEPQNRKVDVGSTISGVGTVYRIFAGAFGKVQFKPCTLVGSVAETEKPVAAKSNAPKDLPMGLYNVYQGGRFTPQGSLTLYKNGTYKRYEKDMGNYSYNPETKVIRFTSGLLEGFVGLYYTSGRNNDKNEPMIAIDYDGKVPDVSNASNGQYLYAIFDKP